MPRSTGQKQKYRAVLAILTEHSDEEHPLSLRRIIELLHTESKEICYFTLVIDNAPPEVQLIGAENGGVTRSNVTLAGLCSGDTIYVYKDGKYLTAYIVEGNSETSLELLGNGDFGSYSVIIEDEAGNTCTLSLPKNSQPTPIPTSLSACS